jgi:hypothetical protein
LLFAEAELEPKDEPKESPVLRTFNDFLSTLDDSPGASAILHSIAGKGVLYTLIAEEVLDKLTEAGLLPTLILQVPPIKGVSVELSPE